MIGLSSVASAGGGGAARDGWPEKDHGRDRVMFAIGPFHSQSLMGPYSPSLLQSPPGLTAHSRSKSQSDFKALTRKDALTGLRSHLQKLVFTAREDRRELYEREFKIFERCFETFLDEADTKLTWDRIKPPPSGTILDYADLAAQHSPRVTEETSAVQSNLLQKLAVVKLNGGLGTSMGCSGPKSLISVRSDLTFLDLHVQQIENLNKVHGVSIPLVLMNSFSTYEDTLTLLPKYNNVNVTIENFVQNKHPRLHKETLAPICRSLHTEVASDFCPSGHGALYESLYETGMLDKLLAQGKEYIFVSNIDNLGATVDPVILEYMVESQDGDEECEFVMEVTGKTAADVKGGTLVEYEGKLRLLEIAQVPQECIDEFKSVSKFRIFNTNNLWINLNAVKRIILDKTLRMDIIVNPKILDNGINVLQLEQAAGAAIKSFRNARGVNVPRSRFLPVKMTSDLLLVMSNLYNLRGGTLTMSPRRAFPSTPLVKLGTHFSKVKDFLTRFASVPDVMELHHLTVSGDVTFGKGVTLKGTVIIIANHGDRIDIPSGSVLENKIVSGNLRILDH